MTGSAHHASSAMSEIVSKVRKGRREVVINRMSSLMSWVSVAFALVIWALLANRLCRGRSRGCGGEFERAIVNGHVGFYLGDGDSAARVRIVFRSGFNGEGIHHAVDRL